MKNKLLRNTFLYFNIISIACVLFSCSSENIVPTKIIIKNGDEEITSLILEPEQTASLKVEILPSNASQGFTWKVEDNSIISISNFSVVTALKEGKTTLTATSSVNKNIYSSIPVTVKKVVLPTSITIKSGDKEVSSVDTKVKDVTKLTSTVLPSEADQSVTWSSDKPNIANVSSDGTVTSESEGSAIITATSVVLPTISKSVTFNVTKDKPSDSDFYIIGTGNFQSGANYSYNGGYQLSEDIDYNGEYDKHFYIEDADFTIGDSFEIKNRSNNYIVNNYTTSSGSFTTNNVSLDKSYSDEYKIDICKTGKYTVDLYQSGSTYSCSITNGTGTTANSLNPYSGTASLEVLSFGDFHGNVEDLATYKPGIARYISAIKQKQNQFTSKTPILINNGDLWQGSYYSNVNHGALLNEASKEAKTDAFCLGNHEFDWGQTLISKNQSEASFPYLGANICSYKDGISGKLVNYVQPYTILEKQNIRIGVIGLIGAEQITSITSSNVNDVTFTDDETAIKKYSDKLRKTFGCEMVIVSDHISSDDGLSFLENLTQTSSVSGKRYIDMMIFGHDHSSKYDIVNGVPYVNSGSNGSGLSYASLDYNNGTVTADTYGVSSVSTLYYDEDANTKTIIDKYITSDIKEHASSIAGTIDSDFSPYAPSGEAPRMMAKAMFEYAQDKGHNVSLAIVNKSRAKLSQGAVPFTDLFTAFPFTNKTIIMKAKGKDIKNEARYNLYYGTNTSQTFEDNKEYLIATYDYLAYHQNEQRQYDWFGSGFTVVKEYYDTAPVDMLYNYMKKQTGTIKATDYQTLNFTFIG